MKNEIKKTKGFDIATFETLDVNGNVMLKGGFSTVYDESLVSGGSLININISKCNTVAGCACVAKAQ